jgi:tetratricopeptide (TPR) repeat protein
MSEFPLVATLEKPYQLEELAASINSLRAEAKFYAKENAVVANTFAEFANDPQIFVAKLISLINLTTKPVPLAVKGSRILQEHGHYEAAESILRVILTADAECVLALHELGKCYLRQRRYEEAKQVLNLANEQCPSNLERLCLLGKANLSSNSFAAAEGNFQDALKVDSANLPAKQGLTAAKIASYSTMEFNGSSLTKSFISAVNARAVAQVHSKRYADALELYGSALQYADDTTTQIKLSFNMGLAFMRWNKPNEALQFFQKCADLSQSQFGKAMRNISVISERYGITSEAMTDKNKDDEVIGQQSTPRPIGGAMIADLAGDEDADKEFVFDVDESGIN